MSLEHPLSVYCCLNEADKRNRMIESLLSLNSSLAFICGRKRTAELQPLTRICLASPNESTIKVNRNFLKSILSQYQVKSMLIHRPLCNLGN